MMLSNEQLDRYRELYKKRFGREISREDALEPAIKLVRLIDIIYQPMTEKEWEMLQKEQKDDGHI